MSAGSVETRPAPASLDVPWLWFWMMSAEVTLLSTHRQLFSSDDL